MKTNYLLLGIVSLILFGCSSPSKNLKTSYSEINEEGMIVGTICIENKTYSGYTFVYTDNLTAVADYANQSDEIVYKNSFGDFREKGKTYFLFSIVKPKGEYKFAKIKIYDNSRERQTTFDIPLDHKFTVEKGKTTYYGQLTINTQEKKYNVVNNLDRDREWFKKKAPQIQL
ncbi:hypothetical protein [Flavobacterium sp.]|uniref:hypothetical protein n=1 Tax=Flavobacterium sp. TaxID=239 RepID=UPI002601EBCA|nr:hypothetical protein [Flavobacterium sp.]